MEWLKQQGPWCPGAHRVPAAPPAAVRRPVFFTYLYAPTVLGLEVNPGTSVLVLDRARRAGDPARDLQGRLQPAGGALLPDRQRAAVRAEPVRRTAAARGSRRRRRRPSPAAAVPAHAVRARRGRRPSRRDRRPQPATRRPARTGRAVTRDFPSHLLAPRRRVPPPAPPLRADRSSTAAGSIRARAARS